MEIKKGIGVSPGVVISTAVVLDAEDLVIPRRTITDVEVPAEIERLGVALAQTVVDLRKLTDEVTLRHGKEIGGIFEFHQRILRDPGLLKQLTHEITANHFTAEYAVSVVMRKYAGMFLKMSNAMFAERVKDIYDIEKSVLKNLVGQ